jgi:uncharacterized protein (DUF1697 family)
LVRKQVLPWILCAATWYTVGVLYVALLRGINVGGKNLIRMVDLKASFEAAGFAEVSTYIASGNVLFRAPRSSSAALSRRIEGMLTKAFGYRASIVLRTHPQMRAVVDGAPAGFGASAYRCDVFFLKEPLKAASVIRSVPIRQGVDELYPGRGVVYFSRLASRATQSRISRIASLPLYKSISLYPLDPKTKFLSLHAHE